MTQLTDGFLETLSRGVDHWAKLRAPGANKAVAAPPRNPLKAPVGYEFTGDFRQPQNEWFLDTGTGRAVYAGGVVAGLWPILRPLVRGNANVPVPEPEPLMPTPPNGWKITGRGTIAEGAFFMQSGDSRVWQRNKAYPGALYAWKVEPELKKPEYAPFFTLTGAYRVPVAGEWFLAKGHGPAAAAGDPVKLGQYDPPISGPRYILEIHKGK